MPVDTPAHQLTQTKFCRMPGCAREARASTGIYAGLCAEHARERSEVRTPPAEAGAGKPAASPGGYEAKVKALTKQGRLCDRHTAKVAKRAAELRAARAELGKAEERFRELAAELVGSERTKDA